MVVQPTGQVSEDIVELFEHINFNRSVILPAWCKIFNKINKRTILSFKTSFMFCIELSVSRPFSRPVTLLQKTLLYFLEYEKAT